MTRTRPRYGRPSTGTSPGRVRLGRTAHDPAPGTDGRAWAIAWGGVVAVGFVNAALHRGYAQVLDEPTATQVSEMVLPFLVVPWALRVERRHPLPTRAGAVTVGAGWALATVAFELLFGHYLNGDTWQALLHAYDLAVGRLWSLDVFAIGAAPVLARAWHRRAQHDGPDHPVAA